ncbi:uncharacterized protein LOC131333640 [Rhododendron vialii]|uniref:uncharacterized protein LOC131333640 n=1 Tax=Rhododendron vialii TaxID=182163 RepID=UPI00265EF52B|nr:uncharacterized protein LOC131333640 [Rhododendron vialii]
MDYDPNNRDQIRRAYLERGPCQPRNHIYPQKRIGKTILRFNQSWFNEFPNWLEYSIAKDAVFCQYCYLFRPDNGTKVRGQSFVSRGFSSWQKKEKLRTHVGGHNSAHNQAWSKCQDLLGQKQLIQEISPKQSDLTQNVQAWSKCQDLLGQKQLIQVISPKQSDHTQNEFQTFLKASIDLVRCYQRQGFLFRDPEHYLFDISNEGLFLDLLKFIADKNEDIKAVLALDDDPQNLELAAADLRKDIVSVAAFETVNEIIRDLGAGPFSIWIDETRDISNKDQMAVVLRYVDRKGQLIEHFLGIGHVTNTDAFSRKTAVEELFSRLGLSISRLLEQGYGVADNVHEDLNGLEALIIEENPCAYCVHFFAYKLQSALVDVSANNIEIPVVFYCVSRVVNVVGASCKSQDILWAKQAAKIVEALTIGELSSCQSLNQETRGDYSGETCCGSHYTALVNLIDMFAAVIEELDVILKDGSFVEDRVKAHILLSVMLTFDFVFSLHLLKTILGITNELSLTLQTRDNGTVNAVEVLEMTKRRFLMMRESGWTSLLDDVSSFCAEYEIDVPNMDDLYTEKGRRRGEVLEVMNLQYYKFEFCRRTDKGLCSKHADASGLFEKLIGTPEPILVSGDSLLLYCIWTCLYLKI